MTRQNSTYFDIIGMTFVGVLLISNTAAAKIISVGPLTLPGGVLLFPISYIFGDVLTEVYGYAASRRIIWTGLCLNALMSLTYFLVGAAPSPAFWNQQNAYNAILGQTPRIVAASTLAYFVGEFSNSIVLAKLKVSMGGRRLWVRTIGSTVVGEGLDSVVFALLAFIGKLPLSAILTIAFSNFVFKVAYEIIATPITYRIVALLKKHEHIDHYDTDTNFNPFSLN